MHKINSKKTCYSRWIVKFSLNFWKWLQLPILHQEYIWIFLEYNKIISRNYFMVRWTFRSLSTYQVLFHCSSFLGFRHAQCWFIWVDSLHHPNVFTVVCLDSSLTQAISPTTLLSRFSFLSTYQDSTSSPRRVWDCFNTSNWELRLTLSQRQ